MFVNLDWIQNTRSDLVVQCLSEDNAAIAVAAKTGQPNACDNTNCNDCLFVEWRSHCSSCSEARKKWLLSERDTREVITSKAQLVDVLDKLRSSDTISIKDLFSKYKIFIQDE